LRSDAARDFIDMELHRLGVRQAERQAAPLPCVGQIAPNK
jgi:hypothetical protein